MVNALVVSQGTGGLFAAFATILSIQNIIAHLNHYVRPEYQLYICRILGMVPVYSFSSWLSLLSPRQALYFDLVRDSYEAYSLYSFVALLINVAGGERQLAYLLELKPRLAHPWPLTRCVAPEQLGARFLKRVRTYMLQFVFIKPLTAAVAIVLNQHGLYVQPKTGDALPMYRYGYPYIWFVVNVSVSLALYWMVMLYLATEDLLQHFRPLPKFLCIKSVIFFSWWQGVLLGLLVQWQFITDVDDFSSDSVATGVQDLLICVEMSVAAVAHHFVFSWKDFEDYAPDPSRPLLRNFGDIMDIRDVLSDAKDALYGSGFDRELRESEPMMPDMDGIMSFDDGSRNPQRLSRQRQRQELEQQRYRRRRSQSRSSEPSQSSAPQPPPQPPQQQCSDSGSDVDRFDSEEGSGAISPASSPHTGSLPAGANSTPAIDLHTPKVGDGGRWHRSDSRSLPASPARAAATTKQSPQR